MELGRTELWNGCPLDTVPGQAERFLFQCINRVPPERDLQAEVESFPTGLIDAARRLELDGHLHVVPPIASSLVAMFGDGIMEELQSLRIHLQDGPEEPLGPHQRRLRAVVFITHPTGPEPTPDRLRYVLERPDGTVMDPATGRNHDDPGHLNHMTKTGRYANTGVSVVLTDPHWQPMRR
jgi:cysteine protease IpaJ